MTPVYQEKCNLLLDKWKEHLPPILIRDYKKITSSHVAAAVIENLGKYYSMNPLNEDSALTLDDLYEINQSAIVNSHTFDLVSEWAVIENPQPYFYITHEYTLPIKSVNSDPRFQNFGEIQLKLVKELLHMKETPLDMSSIPNSILPFEKKMINQGIASMVSGIRDLKTVNIIHEAALKNAIYTQAEPAHPFRVINDVGADMFNTLKRGIVNRLIAPASTVAKLKLFPEFKPVTNSNHTMNIMYLAGALDEVQVYAIADNLVLDEDQVLMFYKGLPESPGIVCGYQHVMRFEKGGYCFADYDYQIMEPGFYRLVNLTF